MIGKAKFPIVLAGNGVVRSCASKALVAFAEKLQIPVTNTFMGKGVVPYDHPLSLMSCGLQRVITSLAGLRRLTSSWP